MIAHDIAEQAARTATILREVGDRWERPGHRSDGKPFTVATLSLYLVHDVEHHLQDVGA